jgi:glutathione S-transferase
MAYTLRYFNLRGRGAALRMFLEDKRVNWVDEVVPWGTPAWAPLKADAALSGPFGTLPALSWVTLEGNHVVLNETMAIAAFVSRLPPESHSLADAQWAQSLQVASKVHFDIVTPVLNTLWAPTRMKGMDIKGVHTAVSGALRRIEKGTFNVDGRPYVVGEDTSIGDYFLFEALDRLSHVLLCCGCLATSADVPVTAAG